MKILAIDPGTTESGVVVYDPCRLLGSGPVAVGEIMPNSKVNSFIAYAHEGAFGSYAFAVIEEIRGYGMTVGFETFQTVWWSGRLFESLVRRGAAPLMLPRIEVKKHLCGTHVAKGANVRDALLRKFGPDRDTAIGRKARPGPLFGIKSHCWAALALAVTAWETRFSKESTSGATSSRIQGADDGDRGNAAN